MVSLLVLSLTLATVSQQTQVPAGNQVPAGAATSFVQRQVMPQVIDSPFARAMEMLPRRRGAVDTTVVSSGRPGYVLRQIPEAGTPVTPETQIRLFVGPPVITPDTQIVAPPGPVTPPADTPKVEPPIPETTSTTVRPAVRLATVPNVTGLTRDQARQLLRDSGLVMLVRQLDTIPRGAESVSSQSHQPGQVVARGTIVFVTVRIPAGRTWRDYWPLIALLAAVMIASALAARQVSARNRRTQVKQAGELIKVSGKKSRGLRVAKPLQNVPHATIRYSVQPAEGHIEVHVEGPLVISEERAHASR